MRRAVAVLVVLAGMLVPGSGIAQSPSPVATPAPSPAPTDQMHRVVVCLVVQSPVAALTPSDLARFLVAGSITIEAIVGPTACPGYATSHPDASPSPAPPSAAPTATPGPTPNPWKVAKRVPLATLSRDRMKYVDRLVYVAGTVTYGGDSAVIIAASGAPGGLIVDVGRLGHDFLAGQRVAFIGHPEPWDPHYPRSQDALTFVATDYRLPKRR